MGVYSYRDDRKVERVEMNVGNVPKTNDINFNF